MIELVCFLLFVGMFAVRHWGHGQGHIFTILMVSLSIPVLLSLVEFVASLLSPLQWELVLHIMWRLFTGFLLFIFNIIIWEIIIII